MSITATSAAPFERPDAGRLRRGDLTLPQISVYLAGPLVKRQEIDFRARQLHAACGMHITSRWHRPGVEVEDIASVTDEQRIMYARMNVVDINAAHWFILNSDLGNTTRGGMHWEHGYATHRGLYCVVIGGAMSASLFAHLPENMAYPDWPAFMQFMQG